MELKQIFETVIGIVNQLISNDAWKSDMSALDLLAACVKTLEKILNWNFAVLCMFNINIYTFSVKNLIILKNDF